MFYANSLQLSRDSIAALKHRQAQIHHALATPCATEHPPPPPKRRRLRVRAKLELAPLLVETTGAPVFEEGNKPILALPKAAGPVKRGLPQPHELDLVRRMRDDLDVSAAELRDLEAELELGDLPAALESRKHVEIVAPAVRAALDRLHDQERRLDVAIRAARRTRVTTTDARIVDVMKRRAAAIVRDLIQDVAVSLCEIAMRRWRIVTAEGQRRDKRVAYRRYQGSRLLAWHARRVLTRSLASAWLKWLEYTRRVREAQILASQTVVGLALQTRWRSIAATRLVQGMRRDRLREVRLAAATHLEAFARGRRARFTFVETRDARRRATAVLAIQRASRCRAARILVARRRRQRCEYRAARAIQCWYRRRRACVTLAQLRDAQNRRVAVAALQRAWRGRLGRAAAVGLRLAAAAAAAATVLQKPARIFARRRLLRRARERRIAWEAAVLKYTVRMQAIFRGSRSRKVQQVLTRGEARRNRKRQAAARCLQRSLRRFVAIKRIRDLIATNDETQQKQLPAAEDDVVPRCTECETNDASRFCDQCQDLFCAACFASVHASGRRRDHSYTQVHVAECSECDNDWATRWCRRCDAYFCDTCFDRIHVGSLTAHLAEPYLKGIRARARAERRANEDR